MKNPTILDKDEEVLWEGKPKFISFVWDMHSGENDLLSIESDNSSIKIPLFLISLITLILFFYFVVQLLLFFTLSVIFLILFELFIFLLYRNTHYFFTSKRVIIREGVIGIDYKFIDYDKITSIFLKIRLVDRIFHTGTIFVVPTKSYVVRTLSPNISNISVLRHIHDPNGTLEKLKKISLDIKTDIYFPNKFRPNENPGFKTKGDYKPKQ